MARRTRDDVLAKLFQEFPEEKKIILGFQKEKDILGHLFLASQNWVTREIIQAFKERRFEEIRAAQKKAERLFTFGLELAEPEELI